MGKAITSPLNPWASIFILVGWGLPFTLAGIMVLRKGDLSGLVFLGLGLGLGLLFVLLPQPKYAELKGGSLFLRGCFTRDIVPLDNIEKLTPFWTGKGAFWIVFKSETRFGMRVLVTVPLREILRSFPFSKRFDELESVQDLLKAIVQASLVNSTRQH